MQRLFDLPVHLLAEIFAGWVNTHSLVVLDSATCNREYRAAYLELLRSNEFCVGEVASFRGIQVKEVEWFISRKVKRRDAVIGRDFNGGEECLRNFFHITGPQLKRLRFSCRSTMTLIDVAASFPRLQILTTDDNARMSTKRLGALLSGFSRTLKRLRLEDCNMFDPFPSNSPLPDLEMLSIRGSYIETAFLCRLIECSPSLRSFYCESSLSVDCVVALATHCPQLQMLVSDLGRPQAAKEVFKSCLAMEVVEFTRKGPVAHNLAALQHCAGLKAICMQGEIMETSAQCKAALQARLSTYDCAITVNGCPTAPAQSTRGK
jgi:hypothetical protein